MTIDLSSKIVFFKLSYYILALIMLADIDILYFITAQLNKYRQVSIFQHD